MSQTEQPLNLIGDTFNVNLRKIKKYDIVESLTWRIYTKVKTQT